MIYASTRIGGIEVEPKSNQSGIRFASAVPTDVPFYRMAQLGERVYVYDDIKEYLWIVSKIREPDDYFFRSGNHHTLEEETFFKNANFGSNSYLIYLQQACDAVGVKGVGVRKAMTVRVIRATQISNLHASGHADAAIQRLVCHKQL